MGQAGIEVELQVWKDLAVSKQMLIATATDALGLDAECSTDELKVALDEAIKRGNEAENTVKHVRVETGAALAEMEKSVRDSERARKKAEEGHAQIQEAIKSNEQNMAGERANHIKEMKRIKEDLVKREEEIKAINVALADTPANVVKKMKKLKKDKIDESNARKAIDAQLKSLRKDKQKVDQELQQSKEALEAAAKVVAAYRELLEKVEDVEGLEAVAAVDDAMLEAVEQATGDDK